MNQLHALLLAAASCVLTHSVVATTIVQDFESDPRASGWTAVGDTNLFHWNSTNRNLEVTWNSAQPNSYFHHPLGTIASRDDDFSFAFDLLLKDIGPGEEYLWSFQLAVGLLNIDQAIQPGFVRGSGFDSPNLVEFAYFRADEFGTPDTAYPTFISTNMQFNYNPGAQNSTNHTLAPETWHRISLSYTASNQTSLLVISNLANHSAVGLTVPLDPTFTDFRVGTISINSYNHAGQFPGFEGSILAHGLIDNIAVIAPAAPVQQLSATGAGTVAFLSRSNFVYTLERTTNFISWATASLPSEGTGGMVSLQDDGADAGGTFYRVRAERP